MKCHWLVMRNSQRQHNNCLPMYKTHRHTNHSARCPSANDRLTHNTTTQSQYTLLKCKWSRQLLQSERGLPISNSLFGTLPQDNGNSNRHKNNNNNNNKSNDDVELRNPKPQSLFLSNITFYPDLYLHQFHLITSLHGVSSVWAPSQLAHCCAIFLFYLGGEI